MRWPIVLLLLAATAAWAADFPSVQIDNGPIAARLYLPDSENGYYRGTRFDWSGVIFSLTYAGHEYFGEWQKSDDPYLHDRITGPVEEYTIDDKALGWDEAEPGDSFVRIGVGSLIKPADGDFDRFKTYEVKDYGEWYVDRGPNWIEFTHELIDSASGYGYRLIKRITLTPGQPEMVIDHTLVNLGRKPIATSVYNHNFFVIDGQQTGPDFAVQFPFAPAAANDLTSRAAIDGKALVYREPIEPGSPAIFTPLSGSSDDPADNGYVIQNSRVKAGVRIQGDKPVSRWVYWSPSTTLCAEAYIDLKLAVGESDRWTIRYQFYTTP